MDKLTNMVMPACRHGQKTAEVTLLFAAFATLLSITVSATSEWPTLRKELQKHGLDAASFDDADRRITSYTVKSDDSWFAIAYEHTFLENAGNR